MSIANATEAGAATVAIATTKAEVAIAEELTSPEPHEQRAHKGA